MSQPTILALNGSERLDGNTAWVLGRVVLRASERGARCEVVHLGVANVTPCGACVDCNVRVQPCMIDDDVPGIVQRMIAADAVIYAAPVHGFGLASIMQKFIERAGVGYLRFERPLMNKVAGVIVTGRRYGHTESYAQLIYNVLLNQMILVGSGFPAVVHAGARGGAADDVEGLEAVDRTVDRMIDMLDLLECHRRATDHTLSGCPTPGRRAR